MLLKRMYVARAAERPRFAKSQNGLGGGFDPRGIKTSYAHFLAILGGFHKMGTDPLGSIIILVRHFYSSSWRFDDFQQRRKARAAPASVRRKVAHSS